MRLMNRLPAACEAIDIADDRHPIDFDGQVEIGNQPPDDRQLLPVLFTEQRQIRLRLCQQLGDDDADAVEMPGPRRAAQPVAEPVDQHARPEARRVHDLDGGGIDEVAADARQLGDIAGLVARVAVKVFGGAELARVDENRGDDAVGPFARCGHQREMAGVQGAHRRHQRNAAMRTAPTGDPRTQLADRADYGEGL